MVYGLELEFRRNLDFISNLLRDFKIGANFSLIRSVVDVPQIELDVIQMVDPGAPDTRPFQGQSPYILNANLAYVNSELGLDAAVSYNVFGDRLAYVGREGTPVFMKSQGIHSTCPLPRNLKMGSVWIYRHQFIGCIVPKQLPNSQIVRVKPMNLYMLNISWVVHSVFPWDTRSPIEVAPVFKRGPVE